MLGLGSNISKTGKLGVHDLGVVTSNLVLKHNYDLSSVRPISDGAASFNGTSDYIAINAKPVDTADATYAWWSNSTQTASQTIFSHGSGTEIGAFHVNYSGSGKPLLRLNTNLYQYWNDTGFADDGKWHHWAVVVDVDDMTACKLYCDGVEIPQSIRITSETVASYGNMMIGKDDDSNEFDGYMCNFGVWSSHLSQAQIKSIMNKNYDSLSASEKTDLVSWWNLDSVIPDSTTLVYDNHHGGGEVLGDSVLTGNNSTFDTGTGGWTTYVGGSIAHDTDKLEVTLLTAGSGTRVDTNSLVSGGQAGKAFKVRARIWQGTTTATSLNIYLGSSQEVVTISSTPTYFEVLLTPSSAGYLTIYRGSSSGGTFFIDDVTVKEINGNTGTLS